MIEQLVALSRHGPFNVVRMEEPDGVIAAVKVLYGSEHVVRAGRHPREDYPIGSARQEALDSDEGSRIVLDHAPGQQHRCPGSRVLECLREFLEDINRLPQELMLPRNYSGLSGCLGSPPPLLTGLFLDREAPRPY